MPDEAPKGEKVPKPTNPKGDAPPFGSAPSTAPPDTATTVVGEPPSTSQTINSDSTQGFDLRSSSAEENGVEPTKAPGNSPPQDEKPTPEPPPTTAISEEGTDAQETPKTAVNAEEGGTTSDASPTEPPTTGEENESEAEEQQQPPEDLPPEQEHVNDEVKDDGEGEEGGMNFGDEGMTPEELEAEEAEFRAKYALDLLDEEEMVPEDIRDVDVEEFLGEEESGPPSDDQMKAIIEYLEEEGEGEGQGGDVTPNNTTIEDPMEHIGSFGDKIRTKIHPPDPLAIMAGEFDEEEEDAYGDLGSFASASQSQMDDGGEGDAKVMVLGPDHPKMIRFQKALKAHLDKQIYLADCELRDLEHDLKLKRQERTELGTTLYNLQHEILRQSETMEKFEKDINKMREKRDKTEAATKTAREELQELKKQALCEEQKEMGLRESQKTLDFTEHVVRQAAEKYSGELKVRHLVADKLVKMRAKSEAEKRDQDYYLDKVLTHLQHMELINAGLKRQVRAHIEEQSQLNTYINEAVTEIEALQIEKGQLQRAWNETISVVRARDDALTAARETLDKTKEELRVRESELRSMSRLIQKEQESHEQSVLLLRKRKMEERVLRNQFTKITRENERLKDHLAQLNKVRKTVEMELLRASNAFQRKEKEVIKPRRQLEQLAREKVKLEDQILAALHEQSGLNKAAAHIQSMIKESRQKSRHMENEVARVENENSTLAIDVEGLRAELLRKTSEISELEKRCTAQEKILQEQMKDIQQSERVIQKKTGEVEKLNKKVQKLINQQGGVEMGPLEREIEDLQKQISLEKKQVNQLQEEWLRRQDDLVRLTSQRDTALHQNEILRKEVFIMERKRQRLDSEVEKKKSEIAKMWKATENVRAEIAVVNGKLHLDRSNHEQMDKDNILIQNELQALLKDAEMEAVELETEICHLEEEKLNLIDRLQEIHEQNLQWEKKVHLAKELKDSLRKENEGSNSALRLDIHHMQVRYNEIIRTQEKLIADLERCIERRDRIIQQADLNLQRENINPKHTKLNIQRNFASLKERNRLLVREANEIENQVRGTMETIRDLENKLNNASIELKKVRENIQIFEDKIADASVLKHKNLVEIVLRQEKFRVLESIKYGRYKPSGKTVEDIQRVLEETEGDCMALVKLSDEIAKEYPETQTHLKLVKASILPGVNANV